MTAVPQNATPVEPGSVSLSSAATVPSVKPLRVVAIGGGTGLSTLLRGLRRYVAVPGLPSSEPAQIADLAAVVTVTDDGGSSGRLRKDFKMLPPGDLRNCMVALSEEEDVLAQLFAHRFRSTGALEGHNFGNLFVAALTEITGDFAHAIQLASKILSTRGRIYPVTTANATLVARMDDGSLVRGETSISATRRRIEELMLEPPDAAAVPETLEAIERADLITVGPGSLYTSLVTNLLVRGIPQALARSRGVRVYICNLMTQANESLGLTAADHVRALNAHAQKPLFDYALINRTPASEELKAKYAGEGACQIVNDLDAVEELGVIPVLGDYLEEAGVARHNTTRVARDLLELVSQQPRPDISKHM